MTEPVAQAPQPATQQAPAETPPTAEASAAPPTSLQTSLSLDDLLSEFDTATKPKAEEAKADQPSTPTDPTKNFMDEVDRTLGAMGLGYELRGHLQKYAGTVEALRAEHLQQRDRADFDNVVARFDGAAKEHGYTTPPDFARIWLNSECATNPEFLATLDRRYDSADDARRADRLVKKAAERFLKAAKSTPDPEATADRAAVVWAVRNNTRIAPPEQPKDYGSMSDGEFKAEVAKLVK